jgi:PTS system galactitol-specific IIA component
MKLSELVRPETVRTQVSAADRREVLALIAGCLADVGAVNDGFLPAALSREETSPTGLYLGDRDVNAAIPHAEREHVLASAVMVVTLAEPVEFGRMDDPQAVVPVRLVISPAIAEPGGQVEALVDISTILQEPTLVADLVAAATPDDVLAILREREQEQP